MDIGSISSNASVLQVGQGLSSKQVQNSDQNDDANVTAALEKSQDIDENSVRKVEQGSESDGGSGVSDNNGELQNQNAVGSLVDINL